MSWTRRLVVVAWTGGVALSLSFGAGRWTQTLPAGLPLTAIVVDPSNSSIVFAGTDGGGLFKSTDMGASWAPVRSEGVGGLSNTVVRALFMDAGSSTLYAGTGGGLFISSDGGSSWKFPSNNGLTKKSDVRAVAVDPGDPSTVYAGTRTEGIFKSSDGGDEWEAVNSGLTDLRVSALVVDPSNSSTLYAGTHWGGVFKSTDGGANWEGINTGLGSLSVTSLVLDPGNATTLSAGTLGGGVFRSTDGGANWEGMSSGLGNLYIGAVGVDPSDPSRLYAGTLGGGAFQSEDSGANWTGINNGLTGLRVTALAVDPANAAVLYAGTDRRGTFRSVDTGASWQEVSNGLTNVNVLSLAMDPTDPSTLYAGTDGGGIFKSIDGGSTWGAANNGFTDSAAGPLIFALAVDPSNPSVIYAGVGSSTENGGVFRSTDMGATWVLASNGLGDAVIMVLAIDPTNSSVLYAGSVGEGVFKSTDMGENWVPMNDGLTRTQVGLMPIILVVEALALDPVDPSIVYCSVTGGGIFRSANGGVDWVPVNNGLPEKGATQEGLTQLRIGALAIDAADPSTLYAGSQGEAGVYKSTDGGASWVPLGNGLPANSYVLELVIDPADSSILYASDFFGGGVFQSTDTGATWMAINNGLPPGHPVYSIAVDPTNSSTLYAGIPDRDNPGGVFKSADTGATWLPVDNGLTSSNILALVLDPANPSTLYAGTNREGTFRSTDGGDNWVEISNGLTSPFPGFVYTLGVSPSDASTLYAGTLGAGVFKSTDGAGSWEPVNNGIPLPPWITAMAVDPVNASTVYVSGLGTGALRTTDGGGSWVAINNGLPETATGSPSTLYDLVIDPSNPSTVYAASGPDVLKSTDGGDSWVEISPQQVPAASTFALALDPTNPSTLYAPNIAGVQMSTDGGASWAVIPGGLGSIASAIAVDPANPSALYVGTRSEGVLFKHKDDRGLWTALNAGLTRTDVTELLIDPLNPFTLYASTDGGGVFVFRGDEPLWLYVAGQAGGARSRFDGLAFANVGSESARLGLEVFPADGSAASAQGSAAQGSVERASLVLQDRQQGAWLRRDLFEGDQSTPTWIEMTSSTPDVRSFFQFGTDTLSQVDGGMPVAKASSRLVFTRVFDGSQAFRGQGAQTWLSILNPNPQAVTLELIYRGTSSEAGVQGVSSVMRTIEGRSVLNERAGDLFGSGSPAGAGGAELAGGTIEVEVLEGGGIAGFEVIQLTEEETVLGLNAATGNPSNRIYSAQLASLPGLFTNVNVVNMSREPREVTLTAVQADGSTYGDEVMVVLGAGEAFAQDAAELFGVAQGEEFVGSLQVGADGAGVVGDVIFGDSQTFAYAAAVALQAEPFTNATFSQVANVSGFFTGMAFYYPGEESLQGEKTEAEITIQVRHPDGTLAGQSVRTLAAGERVSQLVEEVVGQIELAGGHIGVHSSQPIVGQILFGVVGPSGIQVFSAVPASVDF